MKVWLVTERVKDNWDHLLDDVDVEDLKYNVLKTFATYDLAKKYVDRYVEEYFAEEVGCSIECYEASTYITDDASDILVQIMEQEVITSEEDF